VLHFIMFADDSNVFFSHTSYDHLIQLVNSELMSASEWFISNKLTLNAKKSNCIVFRSIGKSIPYDNSQIVLNNIVIPQVPSTKFLGIYIDQHLKWKTHIFEISNKIKKNLGIIKRVSYLLPLHILRDLYFTLIYPYLTYCNMIWTSTYDSHLNDIRILQKKAIRVITKSPLNSHTSPLFLEHKLLNITQIKFLQTCIFMYKYINNLLPPSFFSYFDPAPHLICTRSSNDFRPVFARTNVRKFSLGVQGPINWNSLPKEIRLVTSLSHFKTLARAHTLTYIS
jgi:hypothetical protein